MLDRLVEDLKKDEGFRASVYDDATGKPIIPGTTVIGFPTIGYGSMVSADRGGKIPERIAEEWLHYVAMNHWCELTAKHTWLLEQPEEVQRALGNMAYQLGAVGLCKFKLMLAALAIGDRKLAANEALNSTWARQTPERAQRVAALIRGTK